MAHALTYSQVLGIKRGTSSGGGGVWHYSACHSLPVALLTHHLVLLSSPIPPYNGLIYFVYCRSLSLLRGQVPDTCLVKKREELEEVTLEMVFEG